MVMRWNSVPLNFVQPVGRRWGGGKKRDVNCWKQCPAERRHPMMMVEETSCDNENMIHFLMPINYPSDQVHLTVIEATSEWKLFPMLLRRFFFAFFFLLASPCDTSADKADNFLPSSSSDSFYSPKINFMLIFISTRCFSVLIV